MDTKIKNTLVSRYKAASLEEKKLMCLELNIIKKNLLLSQASSSSSKQKSEIVVA